MGSSARKKAEKKKDFQKQKLKVGKAKPKASNVTDTSFKSKGIVLREQSLAVSAPGSRTQFAHHLSLLSSRSDNQRRDSLAFIANQLGSRSTRTSLLQSSTALLSKLLPLTLDGSQTVRTQLLRALHALRTEEISGHAEQILLYARAGLSHMAIGIRETALDLLALAVRTLPIELVSSPGGWTKTLRYFATVLGWPVMQGKDSSTAPKVRATIGSKLAVKGLFVLSQYLGAGLQDFGETPAIDTPGRFPLVDFALHRIPRTASAFSHLGLFRSYQSEDNEAFQDRAERQAAFRRTFEGTFEQQLAKAKKEGGEIGRAAAQTEAAIVEGMADYQETS